MANTYDIGDVVRCAVAFTNAAGTAVDPTTVKFRIRKPDRSIDFYTYGVDAEVIKDSTGNYHMDILIDQSGTWYYRMEGITTNRGAGETSLIIRRSKFYDREGTLLT